MRTRKTVIVMLTLVLSCGLAAASDRWLHVRVEDGGPGGDQVAVNVPLQFIEAILPTLETNEIRGGRISITGHHDFEGLDLRRMLEALRDAPDAEFVTVRSYDETVRVAKERGMLLVHVDEEDGERVRVRMPLEVVDAMLSAGEHELDLLAALRALSEFDGEDLVTVESDDGTSVRIWIDSRESGE